eukprot:6480019-Amphidinium_carterae.2
MHRRKWLPQDTQTWVQRQLDVEAVVELRYPKAWLDKDFVQSFSMDEMEHEGEAGPWGEELYVAGSASDPAWPYLRRSGWAVIELTATGDLCKACYGPVPVELGPRQCVADGGAMAVAVALMLRPGTVHVHTDCSEVYNAIQGQGRCSKVRGHWWRWSRPMLWSRHVKMKWLGGDGEAMTSLMRLLAKLRRDTVR